MRDTSPRTYLSSFYSENTPENCYLSFVFSYLSSIFRVSLIIYYFLFSGNFLLYIDSVRTSSCNINTGLLQTAATKELKQWADLPESGIDITGRGSHRVYVKKKVATE